MARPTTYNLLGKTFGLLRVVAFVPPDPGKKGEWLCECTCGNRKSFPSGSLRSGSTQSCGCSSNFWKIAGLTTHGMSYTREHRAWQRAKYRCKNTQYDHYDRYGGRGISIDPKWLNNFAAFYADMGPCPTGYELDRINNDGNYEPGNCRWATRKQQCNNTRATRFFDWKGERISLKELSRRVGMNYLTLHGRLERGWSIEKSVSHPVRVLKATA